LIRIYFAKIMKQIRKKKNKNKRTKKRGRKATGDQTSPGQKQPTAQLALAPKRYGPLPFSH
jgi:hypothetical protein